jgi:hypothetical protein
VADRAFCVSLYARLLRLNPAARHRKRAGARLHVEPRQGQTAVRCVNAVQRRQSAKTFLLYVTPPLCIFKDGDKWTNLQQLHCAS